MYMKKVDAQMNFPQMEQEVLQYWQENQIFEKSVGERDTRPEFVFYDGPPFATGLPHYGHLLQSIVKDIFPRYKTMTGHRVERRWGWDCHGLPIENLVEKELGFKSKKDIEAYGVEKFNELCRSKVTQFAEDWKVYVERLGRFVDMDNSYFTMSKEYMESVWWVWKSLWDKGLVYESYRTMHICPRCETTLSQAEVSEGYKDVKDLAVTAKFEVDQTDVDDVAIALIEQDGKVLFVYQKEEEQYFFVGGGVETGETLEETLIRECREELGVEVKAGKKLYQSFRIYQGRLKRLHVFETEIVSGEPALQEDQHTELIWRTLEPAEDLYKDLEMNRLNLAREGRMPAEVEKISFLAWTTTPWTLPGNVALAIGKDIEYAMVYSNNFSGELLIVAQERLESLVQALGEYVIVFVQKGEQLMGTKYLPPFRDYYEQQDLEHKENGWKVYHADFVTTEMGTGIAHEAPAFGEDDMILGKLHSLPWVQHVAMDGTMKPEVKEFAGMQVKPIDKPEVFDVEIIKSLAGKGLLFAKEKYEHSYPHCWRCDTPLLNYATGSWFVAVEKIKVEMLENAKSINWSPEHVKAGRFGKWLEGARDWSVSRQRFWASCIPLWECACGEREVIGSVKELEAKCGQQVDDLHKHTIDKLTWSCGKCGGEMKRIPDVLDTWFDSGSMPYAMNGYTGEGELTQFPADFIAEMVEQTRTWFYYQHVLGTALYNQPVFKNAVATGVILAEDGRKMSKKLQNYPDPMHIFDTYGADALRLYITTSPVVQAENLNFSEKDLQTMVRNTFRMLWNSYSFFTTYASIDNWSPSPKATEGQGLSNNILDRWVLSELQVLIQGMTEELEAYRPAQAARLIAPFVDDLSNWYIRRSRKRFWKSEDDGDKNNAYQTLYTVLVELSKLMAPFTPFMAEEIYRNLTGEESVHLAEWPEVKEYLFKSRTLEDMKNIRQVITMGLDCRVDNKIKVRQPLKCLYVAGLEMNSNLDMILCEELNVKEIFHISHEEIGSLSKGNLEFATAIKVGTIYFSNEDSVPAHSVSVAIDCNITPELKLEGEMREIIRAIQEGRKKADFNVEDRIVLGYAGKEDVFAVHQDEIAREVLATEVSQGELADAEYTNAVDIEGTSFTFWLKRV